jgi:hypothetical protein
VVYVDELRLSRVHAFLFPALLYTTFVMASPLFVFDTLDEEGMEAMLGDAPPQQIADTMHKAWVNFATTGDPCWPQFAEESITIKNPPRENYQGVSYHPGSPALLMTST